MRAKRGQVSDVANWVTENSSPRVFGQVMVPVSQIALDTALLLKLTLPVPGILASKPSCCGHAVLGRRLGPVALNNFWEKEDYVSTFRTVQTNEAC